MDPVSIQAMDHMLLLVNDVHNKWVTHSPHTHTHSFAPCSQAVLEDDSLSFKGLFGSAYLRILQKISHI